MADFHQIWSRNVFRCLVEESGKTFSKIFTSGVICPQNLKSKVGQTGTSLRAGYRSRDALQRDTMWATSRCSPRTREFPRSVNFSLQRTIAELWGVKIAHFSHFGLFAPYTKPVKRTFRWPAIQPRGYIAEWLRFFFVVVEGPKGCLPAAQFSCKFC